jgi:hypothetical protein
VVTTFEEAKVPIFVWLYPDPYYGWMMEESDWLYRYRNTSNQTCSYLMHYMATEVGIEKPAITYSLDPGGEAQRLVYYNALVKAGVPEENIVNIGLPLGEQLFYTYITEAMSQDVDCWISGATQQTCLMYLQADELGYEGVFASYTGMTDVQAIEIMGPNYADFIAGKVWQTEGVDAFTHPDQAVREWGLEFFDRYGEYPIDLVPWCWDQIMVAVSAAYHAGTVEASDAYKNTFKELPFDFLLADELKTPMSPQRDNKFFDEDGQALMEVMVCTWTEEGIKIPAVFAVVQQDSTIVSEYFPTQDLIDSIIQEYKDRKGTA